MKDNNIEVFHNQLEAMVRIKELKENGYKEKDMYIISGDENNISMLRGSIDVMIKEEEAFAIDRFKSFLKGEDSITEAFTRMGLSDEDKEFYHNEVKNGKIILYINKDYGSYYELNEEGLFKPIISSDEVDANLDNVTVRNEEPFEDSLESTEHLPENIKRDIGIEGNPDIEDHKDKVMTDLIMEQARNPVK